MDFVERRKFLIRKSDILKGVHNEVEKCITTNNRRRKSLHQNNNIVVEEKEEMWKMEYC